jgi:hypothetical protein
MRTRHAFAALLVALLLSPIVLSVGMILIVPVALVLLPVLVVVGLAALPAVLASIAPTDEPARMPIEASIPAPVV